MLTSETKRRIDACHDVLVGKLPLPADQVELITLGPVPSLGEKRRIVAELDAEAAQVEAVRSPLPRFEAKIQRVLDRV